MREGTAGYSTRITDIPKEERPRERLLRLGPGALSTAELLAIQINTGLPGLSAIDVASAILADANGIAGLMHLRQDELSAVRGLGPAKAARILAALELGRRAAAIAPESRPTIKTPEDVVNLLGNEMALLEQEELRVILLNTKAAVLKVITLYRGSVNGASVRIAELFREAVRANAVSVIIVHNHPSGDPTPSVQDIAVTSDAVRAGAILDVRVLDHIIIGHGRHSSLKRLGLGFQEA